MNLRGYAMGEAIRVASAAEIPPGSGKAVDTKGRRIAVFNVGGRYHAVDDACPHEGGPLSEGALDGKVVTCPWHGARFDVATGAVLGPPAEANIAAYPVRVSGADLVIELPTVDVGAPADEAGQSTLTLSLKRPEAPDVMSFLFRSEEPLQWQAGQFLRYRLPHPHPDDRGTARYFTIASAPFEGDVLLTTRFARERSSTFKRALCELSLGARIEVSRPAGDFTLSDPDLRPVMIAGGIGITPFRAMLLDLDARGVPVDAALLYANRTPDCVYQAEIDALCRRHRRLAVRHFVSPARITPDAIAGAATAPEAAIFLVSGPEPFVRTIQTLLSEAGVPDPHVKRDYFPGYDWA
jgi:ferredoxin-NADP reductase/nitrite reductase/ring-hydroxylating ferredoxin subunit